MNRHMISRGKKPWAFSTMSMKVELKFVQFLKDYPDIYNQLTTVSNGNRYLSVMTAMDWFASKGLYEMYNIDTTVQGNHTEGLMLKIMLEPIKFEMCLI